MESQCLEELKKEASQAWLIAANCSDFSKKKELIGRYQRAYEVYAKHRRFIKILNEGGAAAD